jgi:hypothetical protein
MIPLFQLLAVKKDESMISWAFDIIRAARWYIFKPKKSKFG